MLIRDSPVPLHAQLEEILRERIARGEWEPGGRIPSENELNRIYGVSRMTVRGVLTRMVDAGLLRRVPGKGTFVAYPKITAVAPAYQGVREQLEALGYDTVTHVLRTEVGPAPAQVREALGLDPDEAVHHIVRVRTVDDVPVSLHHSWVPVKVAPDLTAHDVATEQLCVILADHFGLAMALVDERLEAVEASDEQARHLRIRAGRPVLVLEDTIFDDLGRAFEHSRVAFSGDKIRLRLTHDLAAGRGLRPSVVPPLDRAT